MNKFYVALGTALILFGLTGCGESEADKLAKLQMERAKQVEQRAEAARKRRLENTHNPINDLMAKELQEKGQQKND